MNNRIADKIGLTIALFGLIGSITFKDWVAVGLWVLVIIQDFRIIQLEEEIDDLG